MKFDKIADKILKEASRDSAGYRLGRGSDEYPTRSRDRYDRYEVEEIIRDKYSILKDGKVVETHDNLRDAFHRLIQMRKEHPGSTISMAPVV